METSLSAKERRSVYRSLKLLIKGLENCSIIVDLRNESCVTGVVEQVDGYLHKYFFHYFHPCFFFISET